jgi:hypothetical protein
LLLGRQRSGRQRFKASLGKYLEKNPTQKRPDRVAKVVERLPSVWCQLLMTVILVTQEAEIRRIEVRSQPREIVP